MTDGHCVMCQSFPESLPTILLLVGQSFVFLSHLVIARQHGTLNAYLMRVAPILVSETSSPE